MPTTITSTVITLHGEGESLPGSFGATRPSRVQLVVIDGPDAGRTASLESRPVIIGTAEDCDLVLRDDRVSRRHLEVSRRDGHGGARWLVRDLGSTNGTLYEGSLLVEARVPAGATFRLGRNFVRIQPEPQPLEVQPSQSRRFGDLVAESLAMREVFAVMELAAASEATLLLEGETGTGKELAARAVHEASGRRRGPFVAVDCGALPETLLESELFGHVRGAFTGASTNRAGAFVRASGGTLFLDELTQVSAPVQARLLRAIEERRVRPVGADTERDIDVRIIAASRQDMESLVAAGAMRSDLYYRLSVVRVVLPPLRVRREDILPIVSELLRRRGLDGGRKRGPDLAHTATASRVATIADAGNAANIERLMAHSWPGNVRELRNVIDRALALSPGARGFADLRLQMTPTVVEDPLGVRADLPYAEAKQALLAAFEQRYLRDLIARAEGNISAASRASGIDRKHLRMLLRRQGLIPAVPTTDSDGDGESGK